MALALSLGLLLLLFVVFVASRLQDAPTHAAAVAPTEPASKREQVDVRPLEVFRVTADVWTSLDPAVHASLRTWGPWLIWDGHAESPPVRVGLDAWDSLQTALQAAQVPYHAIRMPDTVTPRESGLHEASASTSTLRRSA